MPCGSSIHAGFRRRGRTGKAIDDATGKARRLEALQSAKAAWPRTSPADIDSAIAEMRSEWEERGWRDHTPASRQATQALLDQLHEVGLTPAVVDCVIDIRSRLTIKLPDAIVAASVLVEDLPLMTRNTDDFKRVPGLIVIDPF